MPESTVDFLNSVKANNITILVLLQMAINKPNVTVLRQKEYIKLSLRVSIHERNKHGKEKRKETGM